MYSVFSSRKRRQFHYEVFTLEIDESRQGQHFIPFSIKLPQDVEEIVGVMMRANAVANIGKVYFSPNPGELGTPSALTMISTQQSNELSFSIAQSYEKYKKTGILNGKIVLRQDTSGGTFFYTLKLDEYVLGSVSLQSYEKSGQFYAQDLSPNRLKICATVDDFSTGYQEDDFIIRDYSGQPDDYVPVRLEGRTKEIFGFFRTTDFGKAMADPLTMSEEERASSNFPRAPYQIRVYLKCKINNRWHRN